MRIKLFLCLICFSLILTACNTVSNIPSYIPPITDSDNTQTYTPEASPSPSQTDSVITETPGNTQLPDNNTTPTPKPTEETPDPTPTPTPTPTPSPEPTVDTEIPEPDYSYEGSLPQSPAVSGSFFDDAAFVGDSVSMRLRMHALANPTALGKANFFTVGSFSAYEALQPVGENSIHPSYQGKKMTVEDCIAACGAKKVYIMLGMNDISDFRGGADIAVQRYTTLVKRILAKNPNVTIYVQSMTPTLAKSSVHVKGITNQRIKEFNYKLLSACLDNGWNFVNVASVMYDNTGKALKAEYCSDPEDMALHLTDAAAKVWVQYLKTHTAS